MKLTSQTCTLRGSNAVRFTATIGQSKKLGLKRHQKTWSFPTVAPQFTRVEMMPTVEAEAKRWEQRILKKATPTPPASDAPQESSPPLPSPIA